MHTAHKSRVAPVALLFLVALPPDSGSQKVQHRFGGFKHKIELNFESRIVVSTNSPDLERGPGTRSIGEEFFETTILVIEL